MGELTLREALKKVNPYDLMNYRDRLLASGSAEFTSSGKDASKTCRATSRGVSLSSWCHGAGRPNDARTLDVMCITLRFLVRMLELDEMEAR